MAQDWLRIEGPLGQLKKKIHQKKPRQKIQNRALQKMNQN